MNITRTACLSSDFISLHAYRIPPPPFRIAFSCALGSLAGASNGPSPSGSRSSGENSAGGKGRGGEEEREEGGGEKEGGQGVASTSPGPRRGLGLASPGRGRGLGLPRARAWILFPLGEADNDQAAPARRKA